MMRKSIVRVSALAVLLLGCGLLLGQDTQTPSRSRRGLPANWARLGLSVDQKAQIAKIQAEYRTKFDELNKQIEKLRKQQRADMQKILTDAQRARLREMLANRVGLDADEPEAKPKEKAPK